MNDIFFEFTIGGFSHGREGVQIKDGALKLSESIRGIDFNIFFPLEPQPINSKLEQFFQELDSIEIWSWKEEYYDEDVLDGTQWELSLKIGNKSINSYGSNDYPNKFNKLIQFINKLVDDEVF